MPTLTCRFSFADFLMPFRASRRHAAPNMGPERAPMARTVPGHSPELEDLRSAAMRRLFPKLHAWGRRSALAFMLQAHAYLAEATSVDDLEQRIRHIERQQHFRH
jgi:hypothetical protein